MREASKTAALYTIVLINRILSVLYRFLSFSSSVAQAPDAGSVYVSRVVAA